MKKTDSLILPLECEHKIRIAVMGQSSASQFASSREMRRRDPFMDRRSGENRRTVYSLDFFQKGKIDRRERRERRTKNERRADCVRISEWSSVCPNYEDEDCRDGLIWIRSVK